MITGGAANYTWRSAAIAAPAPRGRRGAGACRGFHQDQKATRPPRGCTDVSRVTSAAAAAAAALRYYNIWGLGAADCSAGREKRTRFIGAARRTAPLTAARSRRLIAIAADRRRVAHFASISRAALTSMRRLIGIAAVQAGGRAESHRRRRRRLHCQPAGRFRSSAGAAFPGLPNRSHRLIAVHDAGIRRPPTRSWPGRRRPGVGRAGTDGCDNWLFSSIAPACSAAPPGPQPRQPPARSA